MTPAGAGGDEDPGPLLDPEAPTEVEDLGAWVEPTAALGALGGARRAALLLSGADGHPASRFSILARDPVAEIRLMPGVVEVDRRPQGGAVTRIEGDPFAALRRLLPAGERAPDDLPWNGGAIGFLGYALRTAIERLPRAAPDPFDQPDGWLGIYDEAILFDHRDRRVLRIAVEATGEGRRRGDDRRAALRSILGAAARPRPAPAPLPVVEVMAATPRAGYLRAVERALEHVAAGDLYQVNLSHRIEAPLRETPIELFVRLAAANPAPFAAYLDIGAMQIVSASPERFVSLRDGVAESRPIKGTRPRGATPMEDAALARALQASPKDRAENVMIVDLVRNDLGRVVRPGSVRVETLWGLESFATVHHLVSTVTGRLRDDCDRIDLVRALFPGGSMTGAPKIRAMEVIAALEREERGVYAGAVGHLARGGGLDLNIVIRTIVSKGGRAMFRVGGGIVADSDPGAEHAETLDKARALLAAIGGRMPASERSPG